MEDLTKYTPTELLKMGNDIKARHDALKKAIADDTIRMEELDKGIIENLKEMETLEKNYVEIVEKLSE